MRRAAKRRGRFRRFGGPYYATKIAHGSTDRRFSFECLEPQTRRDVPAALRRCLPYFPQKGTADVRKSVSRTSDVDPEDDPRDSVTSYLPRVASRHGNASPFDRSRRAVKCVALNNLVNKIRIAEATIDR